MVNKKIVIAGGSGFIGEALINYFGKENDIVILTRKINHAHNNRNKYELLKPEDLVRTKFVKWNGRTPGEWWPELENTDVLINMAGKSVNCRYTRKNKEEILRSRVESTSALGQAIRLCKRQPALWINASSATIYRHAVDRPQDEITGEIKDDFSVQVCKQWEKTFFEQSTPNTRKVALRMAITLGSGGVLLPYFNLLKFKLGGKQGNGQQYFSWVHVEDTCRMIDWLEANQELHGVFNCSSPNPVPNDVFMQTLRKATGHKTGLPAPAWMLKLGAAMIGTETELILKSRWVIPTRALNAGFAFKYPLLEDAFAEIISKIPRNQYHISI